MSDHPQTCTCDDPPDDQTFADPGAHENTCRYRWKGDALKLSMQLPPIGEHYPVHPNNEVIRKVELRLLERSADVTVWYRDRPELLAEAERLKSRQQAHVNIINRIAESLGLPEGSSDEDADDAIRSLQAEVERLNEEIGEVRALLAPVSPHESLEGAIRNLRQALLSEQGNVAILEGQRDALAEALEAVERKLRTLRGRTSREEVWLECEDLEPLHEQVLAALRAAAGGL